MKTPILFLLLFSLFFISCEGLETEILERGPSDDYMGLVPGARWDYQLIWDEGFGKREKMVTFTIEEDEEREDWVFFFQQEHSNGEEGAGMILARRKQEYFLWGRWWEEMGERQEHPFPEPLRIMIHPLPPGGELEMIGEGDDPFPLEVTGRETVYMGIGNYRAFVLEGAVEYFNSRDWMEILFVPYLGFIQIIKQYQEKVGDEWVVFEEQVHVLKAFQP